MSLLDAHSAVPGVDWPPVFDGPAATLAAHVGVLAESEWLAPDAIADGQRRQLHALATYCAEHSDLFAARLAGAGLDPDALAAPGGLARLPPMGRRDVQQREALLCRELPARHLPVAEARTSGSTGEPVAVVRTAVSQLDWLAITLRDHLWHGRDLAGRLASIRANIFEPRPLADWGPPVSLLFASGPSLGLPITLDADALVAALIDFAPTSLVIYPTTLAAVLAELERSGRRLAALKDVRTLGETLSAGLRAEAAGRLAVPIVDGYSSQEVGYIALQCPVSGLYHGMAETLIVEVLDAAGAPCAPGEVGRVVVTDLRNFATPLVRYVIGDYAEPATPCPCGRGLPTLARILGRERNLLRLPDGRTHWPLLGRDRFRDLAPVAQFQIVQTSLETVEVRLVVERALTETEEAALTGEIQRALGHPFACAFRYFAGRLPTGQGSKFEEFRSELAVGRPG